MPAPRSPRSASCSAAAPPSSWTYWPGRALLLDGWPWGWGADSAGFAEGERRPWVCTSCRTKQRASEPPLWYPAGTFSLLSTDREPVCPDCARTHCQRTYLACDLYVQVDGHCAPQPGMA